MTQTAVLPTLDQLRRVYPTLRMLEAEAEAFQETTGRGPSLRNRSITIADKAVQRFGPQRVYDLIYDAVYQKLPDCKNCGCMRREG